MVKSKILSKYPNLIHFFGDKNSKFDFKNIIISEQVHENKVALLTGSKEKFIKDSDGFVTNHRLTLGILTADCLPIFFYDPRNKIIAAVHAGWKGLSSGIIKNTIAIMKKLGSKSEDCLVSVGPHIQVCCYKVRYERIKKFSMTNRSDRIHLSSNNIFGQRRKDGWYLDLSKVAINQLKSFGVMSTNVENSDICTCCNKNFWSFRRDGQSCGRMLNVIGTIEQNHAIA